MEFPIQELDFRFADEEDSQDIALLVPSPALPASHPTPLKINRSLNHEIEGEESFRKENSSRITLDEVRNITFFQLTHHKSVVFEDRSQLLQSLNQMDCVRDSKT